MKGTSNFETSETTSKQDFLQKYFSSYEKYDKWDNINILGNDTWLKPICQAEEVKEFACLRTPDYSTTDKF